RISQNQITLNGSLGIDLGTIDLATNGVTQNDSCDPDTGGNDLQNFPVIASAVSSGGNTTIEGSLNSQPRGTFTLDFYVNDFCDGTAPIDFGEARPFLGSKTVTTASNSNAGFTGSKTAVL